MVEETADVKDYDAVKHVVEDEGSIIIFVLNHGFLKVLDLEKRELSDVFVL
ncbi:hypothetical protein TanjilG_14273 [Lupinus angustifolius]|uniref:Uncharacterized protein n=1 Tax=Lupinus angustifolius TaxID=3871 RepID=A0A1J7HAD4_LUPAN|nr:hypothetical protein TanjilG_14273 [Lupinus angustifolius]